ncbi:MAG: DUF951 domain-containing protein [Tenericutes bacterium HGW-Tenericutes-2]|jgi:hypothetical protein|nr:MAG: DUF951 domain-containing protein [Tenericutes bacterium HGW-Tenericutes-2]
MKYNIGDHIITKKKHVCGSDEWEVLRTGAEIKIKCIKCSREIMVFKTELDKKIKTPKE